MIFLGIFSALPMQSAIYLTYFPFQFLFRWLIIDGHLPQPEGTQADDADEEDNSQEVAPVLTKEASNMLQSLETFWLQQDDDNAVFILH